MVIFDGCLQWLLRLHADAASETWKLDGLWKNWRLDGGLCANMLMSREEIDGAIL